MSRLAFALVLMATMLTASAFAQTAAGSDQSDGNPVSSGASGTPTETGGSRNTQR